MKKIFIMIVFLLQTQIVFGNQNELKNIEITIQNKTFLGSELQKNLDKIINKAINNNLEKKEKIYLELSNKIEEINKNKNDENLSKINIILDYSIENVKKEIEIYNDKIKKITLGYTKKGFPIDAYYSGDPKKGYFGIFASIHGGYEYGTYETANYLIKEFQKSGKTGWFIIPTINPEGLEYYKNSTQKYDAYLNGRTNENNVDLNRNFCTKNFELKNFVKNGISIKTGINNCESEAETRIIVEIIKKYKFNKIISLHSEGEILYIPDNSIDDKRVIDFGYQILNILPTYKYDIIFQNDYAKKQKIKEYEINEGGSAKYTGTMETYIYENYNIPIILLEIAKHGKIEYNLKDIINIIN